MLQRPPADGHTDSETVSWEQSQTEQRKAWMSRPLEAKVPQVCDGRGGGAGGGGLRVGCGGGLGIRLGGGGGGWSGAEEEPGEQTPEHEHTADCAPAGVGHQRPTRRRSRRIKTLRL